MEHYEHVRASLREGRRTTLALPERARFEMTAAAAYGFVGYVLSIAALGAYLMWAWVPDDTLASMGITYLPRWSSQCCSWLVGSTDVLPPANIGR
jgi:hypothetical protein